MKFTRSFKLLYCFHISLFELLQFLVVVVLVYYFNLRRIHCFHSTRKVLFLPIISIWSTMYDQCTCMLKYCIFCHNQIFTIIPLYKITRSSWYFIYLMWYSTSYMYPQPKLACFVLYLKLSICFWKKTQTNKNNTKKKTDLCIIIVNCPRNANIGLKWNLNYSSKQHSDCFHP